MVVKITKTTDCAYYHITGPCVLGLLLETNTRIITAVAPQFDADLTLYGNPKPYNASSLLMMASIDLVEDFGSSRSGFRVSRATMCSMTPCFRSYAVNVNNGKVQTRIQAAHPYLISKQGFHLNGEPIAPTAAAWWLRLCYKPAEIAQNDIPYEAQKIASGPNEATNWTVWYNVDHLAFCAVGLGEWTNAITAGVKGVNTTQYGFPSSNNPRHYYSSFTKLPNYLEHIYTYGGLPSALKNITDSLTAHNLRSVQRYSYGKHHGATSLRRRLMALDHLACRPHTRWHCPPPHLHNRHKHQQHSSMERLQSATTLSWS